MDNTEFRSDHDLIVTLVANMKELRTKQSENHEEIKHQIVELTQNYSHRLDTLETTVNNLAMQKLSSSDWTAFRNNEYIPDHEKLGSRITWLERIAYGSIGALFLIELYFRYFKK